jgi:hypothetical protein
MNHKLASLIFSLGILILAGCGIKTKLNRSELKWMDVYNENDTLIFRSEKGELDTSVIIKKELFYPEYNPIEQHGRYLPEWGVVWYKNRKLEYHPDGYHLITMEKDRPKSRTSLSINYLYVAISFLDITTGSPEKYKIGEVYEFDTYDSRFKPWQPKKIYWREKYGIIKYITMDDVMWQRINYRR